jgi:GNAT superfamily N-acetyltransferase
VIRHVRPGDGAAIAAFYAALSPDSRRSRFFGACRGLSEVQAQRLARARSRGGDGLLAIGAGGEVLGHLCLEPLPDRHTEQVEEIAVAVADKQCQRGIGRALLDAAIRSARRRGVIALEATMLTGNAPIHALLEHTGLIWHGRALEPGREAIRIELGDAGLRRSV